jgi:cystathionine beta-lyase
MAYLEANRDFVAAYAAEHLPGVRVTPSEGTFPAGLDCRSAGIPDSPNRVFRERGKVMLNEGATFGPGGEGFVRLNFGCPRSLLTEGLERMRKALASL